MSQISQTTAPNLTEGYPVTNLTLVVLLLIPCVVILLLLNCLFLGYKFLILSKKNCSRQKREDTEEMLLQSTLHRVGRVSDSVFPPLQDGRRAYMSLSEPALLHPVTSSRASSRERASRVDQRIRLLRPDGATGSGSLRAPSTIRATSSAAGFTPRLDPGSGLRAHSISKAGWCKSAPVLPQSSDSETETRVNLVPPNSPTQETEHGGHIRRCSAYDMLTDVSPDVAVHVFDKVAMECEYTNPPSVTSCPNTSAVGPGLDSDFGASAGVSLRILSADSDGLSNGVLSSALEWDYYDPCYVKQNTLPKHKHHRPVMHTKQYWV
ncbi:protein huluwa isoform X1 [Xyrichtys novacula]|uniref:Protein huluwa isoform X1 n=1 Tax=Xyrichtys novacula TaxID=13765 RepID=A0AAV1G9I0_XYRNO|nr:protein huluwa isoform X1 [Xyrichtys novacula]